MNTFDHENQLVSARLYWIQTEVFAVELVEFCLNLIMKLNLKKHTRRRWNNFQSRLCTSPAALRSAVFIAACSPSYDLTLAIVRIQIAGFEMEKNSARKLSLKRKKSFSSGTSTQCSDDWITLQTFWGFSYGATLIVLFFLNKNYSDNFQRKWNSFLWA